MKKRFGREGDACAVVSVKNMGRERGRTGQGDTKSHGFMSVL